VKSSPWIDVYVTDSLMKFVENREELTGGKYSGLINISSSTSD
jgi:hypothetical protein